MQYLVFVISFLCGVNTHLENPEPNTVRGSGCGAGFVNLVECLSSMCKALGSSTVSQEKKKVDKLMDSKRESQFLTDSSVNFVT